MGGGTGTLDQITINWKKVGRTLDLIFVPSSIIRKAVRMEIEQKNPPSNFIYKNSMAVELIRICGYTSLIYCAIETIF
jgi:hypothetical protein